MDIFQKAAIDCGIWKPPVKLIENDVWYEVSITVECGSSPRFFTFLNVKTAEKTTDSLPDYVKQQDVDILNAHTRFVTPQPRVYHGSYRFSRHYLTDELCIVYDETIMEYHRRMDVIT